ncbi:tetratricopeptide repeat protein [Flavobacterium covae]|uniref:tetratricopeptide repeat protein n=1 Tax=Flavobacterium covae TaxID=2906076 RepID=UPI000745DD22|nr:tetratricopeptide repeat protein [Flavobacterium covae]AMA49977.1 hypothetical protein AWN65_11170 [Flavobacterium covae]MCJ1808597.1 tetratricopeptide repeat protein [Flavobacterium covae]
MKFKNQITILLLFVICFSYSQKKSSDYVWHGWYKAKNGDFKGALVDYNKAIELNSNDATIYYSRASVKNELGDFYGAINDCNRALKIDEISFYAFFTRAYAWSGLGEYEHAIIDLNSAIKISPLPNFIFYRAETFVKLNKLSDACIDIKKLSNIDIDDENLIIKIELFKENYCK